MWIITFGLLCYRSGLGVRMRSEPKALRGPCELLPLLVRVRSVEDAVEAEATEEDCVVPVSLAPAPPPAPPLVTGAAGGGGAAAADPVAPPSLALLLPRWRRGDAPRP